MTNWITENLQDPTSTKQSAAPAKLHAITEHLQDPTSTRQRHWTTVGATHRTYRTTSAACSKLCESRLLKPTKS